MKKAFSLIEVIFVLVILGIVASLSSQIIVQVYENYIMQRAVYNVSTKTEMVANQIVNRLTYRIQGTTIAKDHDAFLTNAKAGTANGWAANNTHWLALEDVTAGDTYTALEWIGYDNDSFAASQNPAWSGIANYEPTSASINGFNSPGSNLNDASTIMNNLSNEKVDLSNANPAALIFADNNNFYTGTNVYDPLCMGLIPQDGGSSTDCIFPVRQNGIDNFTFTRDQDSNNINPLPKIITERYKLAWSAYSIAPELNATTSQYDLFLYSNYQPWNGESYVDKDRDPNVNINKNLLMKNVTVFKFSETGGVIHFKLCASENIGEDFNVTTCKEKVVIR